MVIETFESLNYFYNKNRTELVLNLILIFIIPTFLIKLKKYFNGGVNHEKPNIKNKIILITGANTGIGKACAKTMAKLGATIICACRDQVNGEQTVREIIRKTKNQNVVFIKLDLSSFQAIKDFVNTVKKKFNKLDILLNNAGMLGLPQKQFSVDGFELSIQTNYFGHFLLTNLLVPLLLNSPASRVVNVSSIAHYMSNFSIDNLNSEKKYNNYVTYGNSKLALILFSKEFAYQFEKTNIKCVAVHPGVVRSQLYRNLSSFYKICLTIVQPIVYLVTKSIEQGAQTSNFCCLVDHNKLVNGAYYSDCKISKPMKITQDQQLGKDLWNKTMQIVGLE